MATDKVRIGYWKVREKLWFNLNFNKNIVFFPRYIKGNILSFCYISILKHFQWFSFKKNSMCLIYFCNLYHPIKIVQRNVQTEMLNKAVKMSSIKKALSKKLTIKAADIKKH